MAPPCNRKNVLSTQAQSDFCEALDAFGGTSKTLKKRVTERSKHLALIKAAIPHDFPRRRREL